MTPCIIHDLIFATRLARPTGVERVALNIFAASAEQGSNVVALVSDRSRVPAGLPTIDVGHYLSGWATAYWRIPKHLRDTSVMICGSAPGSPSMRFSRMPMARIIADDFPWKRSDQMSLKGRLLFRDCENAMLDRYNHILTISDVAQAELSKTLGRDVLLAGCASGIDPTADEQRPDGVGDKPILLLVGTIEPRKNYAALARIVTAELLDRWQVVVAGRPGWKGADEELQAVAGVTWLREASDAHLRWLYRHADTFMTLSLAEGFNMPLVEAGCHGVDVICSDLPIHRSVAPPWARFVGTDVTGSVIAGLLADKPVPPVARDVDRYARKYSWSSVCTNIQDPLVATWQDRHAR